MHGFNLVLEGVRQIRGTSTAQVEAPTSSSSRAARACRRARSSSEVTELTRWRPASCSPTSTTRTSAPFWAGTARGELLVQACGDVRHAGACRRARCARAAGRLDVAWEPTSGRGTIWSFVVPHPPLLPAYAELAPYNVDRRRARRGPDDPLRRQPASRAPDGAINEIDPATIEIGEPVRVVFQQVDDVTLPRWVLA